MMAQPDPQKLKAIKAILFDKDGTLIDFERTWFAFSFEMAKRAAGGDVAHARNLLDAGGYDWETQRFRANSVIAAGTVEDMVALWHPAADAVSSKALAQEYSDFGVSEGARAAVAIEGMRETLQHLHDSGFILGIATNDSEAGAHATAKALKIEHLFAVLIGYDTAERPKPHPDPLLHFAKLIGLQPNQIAMVGDNLHDLETAHAAGAGLAVGVLSGNSPYEVLAPLSDVVLASIADLPALLDI